MNRLGKLQVVKFIGPQTEKKLIESGISNITKLSVMSPEELLLVVNEKNINPINRHQAIEIIHSAKELSIHVILYAKTRAKFTINEKGIRDN